MAACHGHGRICSHVDGEMPTNLASSTAGATVSGDGINLARLVDDDEATNWASLGGPVAGKQVSVNLAGGSHPSAASR